MLKKFSFLLFLSFSCVFFQINQAFAQDSAAITTTEKSSSESVNKSSAQTDSDDRRRLELGIHFTATNENRKGFGGRIGYDFATLGGGKYVATAEAEVNYLPTNRTGFNINAVTISGSNTFNPVLLGNRTNGKMTQGFFGVKFGRRFEKVGFFAKARPGFVQYSRGRSTYIGVNNSFQLTEEANTNFATDVGGVFEYYPTKRITTRFDFGDTIVRFKNQIVNGPATGGQVAPVFRPSETRHNFQFSAGIGFRF